MDGKYDAKLVIVKAMFQQLQFLYYMFLKLELIVSLQILL